MKKIIILLVAVTMLGSFLFAEENVEEVTEMEIIKIIKIEDLDDLENVENLEELEKLGVDLEKILEQNHIQIVGDGIDYCETPFMGIYFGNLSLEKANELSFNKEYGVLINGVVENSPAKFYRLLKDDIIMAVDDKQVKNENAITKIISSYYVGDKVKLSIFRDGEMKDVDFVFGSRNSDVTADGKVIKKIIKKKKKSVGYGGGSWIPVWFKPDLANVNEILGNLDVGELPETGFLTQGGGGKGRMMNMMKNMK